MPACFWQPSQNLAKARVLFALLAVLAALASGLPLAAKTAVALVCASWALCHFLQNRQHGAANQRLGLRYQPQAGWQLWRAKTGWQSIEVLAGSLVTRQLIIVQLSVSRRGYNRLALVVPADVLDAESHRRLRMWLRFIPLDKGVKRFPVRLTGARGNQG